MLPTAVKWVFIVSASKGGYLLGEIRLFTLVKNIEALQYGGNISHADYIDFGYFTIII